MSHRYAVVLAAGKGTRMKSDLAKVLHEIDGKPLLEYVLDACRPLQLDATVVIVGHQADRVTEVSARSGADTALQAEQLGTGHAVDLTGYEEWTLDDEGLILQSNGHYDAAEYERQLIGEAR